MILNGRYPKRWVSTQFALDVCGYTIIDTDWWHPVLSVVAAFITGVVYLIPLNFVLTNISDLLAVPSLQPMPLLFKLVVGSAGGAYGLLFLSESRQWHGIVLNPTHLRFSR